MSNNLIFVKNDVEYMKLCLDLTVYWTGSVFDHSEGVANFYSKALDIIKSKVKFYATEEMGPYEAVTGNTLNLLPAWLSQPDRSRDIMTLSLESGTDADLPSDTALHFWAVEYPENPAGMLRLVLPIGFIQDDPVKLVNLAKNLVGDLEFHSGCGGYAINWDHKGRYAVSSRKEMSIISKRYPGIELPEVAITLMAIPFGLKRVNWLTLVGNNLLETIGGSNPLVARLSNEGIFVDILPKGVLVIAGKEPTIGDVNRQDDLASYHKVGSAVAALRNHDHPAFLLNSKKFPDEEITADWLAYFDR